MGVKIKATGELKLKDSPEYHYWASNAFSKDSNNFNLLTTFHFLLKPMICC